MNACTRGSRGPTGEEAVRRIVKNLPQLRPALEAHVADLDEVLSTVFMEDEIRPWLLDVADPAATNTLWRVIEELLDEALTPRLVSEFGELVLVCLMEVLIHDAPEQRGNMGRHTAAIFDFEATWHRAERDAIRAELPFAGRPVGPLLPSER